MQGTNDENDDDYFLTIFLFVLYFSLHFTHTFLHLTYSFFFQPIGLFPHESSNKQQRHGTQHSSRFSLQTTRVCRSASSSLLRCRSISHSPYTFTYIKNDDSTQTTINFLPTLPTTTTTTTQSEKNMLLCPQTPTIVLNETNTQDNESIFLTCPQLAAAINNNTKKTILVIDCGSPLRHTERRIQDSFLLNVNDKISRKRLITRGLKSFLDTNQLNRFDKNELIVLYDDSIRSSTTCCNTPNQSQLSTAMKCIYDEIKRYDNNKSIYILHSSFDDFYQHYPTLCYISTSTDEDISLPTPPLTKQIDIDFCQISEIIPGLYLGNSQDAENINVLKENQIQTIINISTSIPNYFEDKNIFDYLRLPCHDSPNQDILQHFESTFAYIHEKLSMNKNILVHCQGGVSRSPSFIIGYLMKYHSQAFDQAREFVKTKRSIINPNLNFFGQLTRYQQMINNNNA